VLLQKTTKMSSIEIGGYANRQVGGLIWAALLEMLLDYTATYRQIFYEILFQKFPLLCLTHLLLNRV
jgi:hypothetical protein